MNDKPTIETPPGPGWVWNGTYWMPGDQYRASERTVTKGIVPPYAGGRVSRLIARLRGQR